MMDCPRVVCFDMMILAEIITVIIKDILHHFLPFTSKTGECVVKLVFPVVQLSFVSAAQLYNEKQKSFKGSKTVLRSSTSLHSFHAFHLTHPMGQHS